MRRDQTAADVGRVPANVGMHDGGSGNESDNGVTRSTIEPNSLTLSEPRTFCRLHSIDSQELLHPPPSRRRGFPPPVQQPQASKNASKNQSIATWRSDPRENGVFCVAVFVYLAFERHRTLGVRPVFTEGMLVSCIRIPDK